MGGLTGKYFWGGKYADRYSGYLLPAEGSMKPVGGRVKTAKTAG